MIPDETLAAAVEAAAKAVFIQAAKVSGGPGTWDAMADADKATIRDMARPLVEAAIAVAGPKIAAGALRDAADDFAVIPHPYEGGVTSWLRDRADGIGEGR